MSTQQRPWSNTHVHRSAERRAQGATGGAHGAIPPIPYESREIERREGDGERCARAKTFKLHKVLCHLRAQRSDLESKRARGGAEIPYKNPPHTSVLVRGVRQRRRAP